MTSIELITDRKTFGPIRHALFDFDGTISLIREGWQEVMVPMMVNELAATPQAEPREELVRIVTHYVDELTGKQTMYQMLRFVEEIKKRGGTPKDALAYKHQYLQLLETHIDHRLKAIESKAEPAERYHIPGAFSFLESLHAKGVVCYLASGTDEHFVRREAALLGVDHFFAEIWGAKDDYLSFSKRIALERIVTEHHISGSEMAVFGDGYVEMEVAREFGAVAVGVATDEKNKVGIDEWKRHRLIGAGADIIIPDFSDAARLRDLLGV